MPPHTKPTFPVAVDQAAVAEAMIAVGSASQLEFCTRAVAVEVLLSLAERAPAIVRKCSSVALGLVPLTLALACEVTFARRNSVVDVCSKRAHLLSGLQSVYALQHRTLTVDHGIR